MVAAHALIAAIRGNAKALKDAAVGIHIRCKQAASFLSEIPVSVENTMEEGKKVSKKKGDEKKDAGRTLVSGYAFCVVVCYVSGYRLQAFIRTPK